MADARTRAREWREAQGLSQRDAAKRLGTSQSMVSAVERGARGISLKLSLAYLREAGIDQKAWVEERALAS